MEILGMIERYLRRHDLPPTKFGRLAVGDPRLVGDMRNGRELRAATLARVATFMASPPPESRP